MKPPRTDIDECSNCEGWLCRVCGEHVYGDGSCSCTRQPGPRAADQRQAAVRMSTQGTVLIRCGSHRARRKMLALVGEADATALFSLKRELGKGTYRIPAEHEHAAKAITGITGLRDGDDLMKCWTW